MRLRSAWLHLAAKAFPAKNSPPIFVFNVLPRLSSGRHWRNWVAILLASSKLPHPPQWFPGSNTGRVLQKGDPSVPFTWLWKSQVPSPRQLDHPTCSNLLGHMGIRHQVSVYADDVVVFFTPIESGLDAVNALLEQVRHHTH